jgi:hypothetical protein
MDEYDTDGGHNPLSLNPKTPAGIFLIAVAIE